jgi:hypothetical protein
LKIRQIKVGELAQYLESDEYKRTSVIPITVQRAVSHIQNPRSDVDDIALILAEEENGNVLGFIGLLPDFIFQPEKKKVFWISCWWAHPENGKSLGVPLLLAAYQASNGLLLADASPDTIGVFQKSKLFHVPEPKVGLKLFLQPLFKDVLLRKKPEWRKYSLLLKVLDGVVGLLFTPVRLFQKFVLQKPYNIEVRYLIAGELTNIKNERSNHFQREAKDLKWIMDFPWLLSKNDYKEKRFYPFSSTAKTFKNHLVVFKQAGKSIAYLFLTERDQVFKLHYLFAETAKIETVAKVLIDLLIEKKAKEFITFHPELTKVLSSKKLPFIHSRTTTYQYVCGKGFEASLNLDGFQYGDGDAIFT